MYRDFRSSRERTSHWVQSHVPFEGGFYSPSFPPSNADGFIPPGPPSDVESSHSTPPRMVLHYNDGRHVPIPRSTRESKPRSRKLQSSPGRGRHGDQHPEEIRILPSFENGPQTSNSRHARSKSLPRTADHGRGREPHMAHSSSHHKVKFAPPAQPSQPWHRHKQPPFPPPLPGTFQHPPQFGPNGVIFSHSAPPATGYYPPQFAASMRPRTRYNPAGASVDSLGTEQTYYIHMNRHKVHVIVSPICFRMRWCPVANGILYEGSESCSVDYNSYINN